MGEGEQEGWESHLNQSCQLESKEKRRWTSEREGSRSQDDEHGKMKERNQSIKLHLQRWAGEACRGGRGAEAEVTEAQWRKQRKSFFIVLSSFLLRSLPLSLKIGSMSGGDGEWYAKRHLHNQSSLQNEVSACEAHWCMNAENQKRQQTDGAKGETGAMWAAVHLRQGVGVPGPLSLSFLPFSSAILLSSLFIYFTPRFSFFSLAEGPQPNKAHRPQDDERMLFREMITLPEEYQLIWYEDSPASPPNGSHPHC